VPIDIYKVNSNGETVGGAELAILLPSGTELRTWTSTMGKLRRIDLAAGTYTLHEKSAPDGLKIASDISFEVDGSGKLIVDGLQTDRINMVDEGTSRGTGPEDTPAPTSATSTAARVTTGDGNHTARYIVMIGVASCLLGSLSLMKKKKDQKDKDEEEAEKEEKTEGEEDTRS
jgi:uncharacterized surface anchored protein